MPTCAFDDNAEALSDRQVQRLKSEAHHWSSTPVVKLDINDVDSISTRRDGLADGTITWRTVFGIPYGETRISDQQSEQEWHNAHLFWPVGGLLAAEVALLSFGVWGASTGIRRDVVTSLGRASMRRFEVFQRGSQLAIGDR